MDKTIKTVVHLEHNRETDRISGSVAAESFSGTFDMKFPDIPPGPMLGLLSPLFAQVSRAANEPEEYQAPDGHWVNDPRNLDSLLRFVVSKGLTFNQVCQALHDIDSPPEH